MKANDTHTPGPWRTGDMFNTIFGPPNGRPCPEIVATVHRGMRANARLVAAAPELLAALEELTLRAGIALDYAIQGKTETRWTAKDGIATPGQLATNDTMIRSVALARAAIAKAKGAA